MPHADRDRSEPRNVCGHVMPALSIGGDRVAPPHFCDRREGHEGAHTDGISWWTPGPKSRPEPTLSSEQPVWPPHARTAYLDEPVPYVPAENADDEQTGTSGNRRGPDGYRCCKHCAEDDVHAVETDSHDIACQTCDDPGAMLRERAEAAEATVALVKALVPRDPELIEAGYAVPAEDLLLALNVHRAALDGAE